MTKHNLLIINTLLLLLSLTISCQETPTKEATTTKKETPKIDKPNKLKTLKKEVLENAQKESNSSTGFNFVAFPIEKGGVGPIRINMLMSEAENFLKHLDRKEVYQSAFGADNEEKAYQYSLGEEPLIVLVPAVETGTLVAIHLLHPSFKMANGLSARATVNDIVKQYPSIKVNADMMNGWEYIYDKTHSCLFYFMTDPFDKDVQIGNYTKEYTETTPIRLEEKCDWLTIY